jgi:hypothetical protein
LNGRFPGLVKPNSPKALRPRFRRSFSHTVERAAKAKVFKAVHFIIEIAFIWDNAHDGLCLL